MTHAMRISQNVQVAGLLSELEAHPELWDEYPLRTGMPRSPFAQTSDIWLRFKDPHDPPERMNEPHFPVWYPCAEKLPSARVLAMGLMALCQGEHLGGILITKIPAGSEVTTHCDKGSWHAEHYLTKVYIVLQGNDRCVNYFEDEAFVMRTGEAWAFNNLVPHSVKNDGDTDRISLIVCMRRD